MADRPSLTLIDRLERQAAGGRLAAGTYHDLRHLLAAVSTMIEWSRDSADPAAAAQALDHALRYIRQAGELMDASLRLAAPGSPHTPACHVAELLTDVDLLSRPQRSTRVHWQAQSDPGLPPVAIAHAPAVHLLLNLVLNACSAMGSAGGHLRLDARHAAATHPSRAGVCIQVTDTGPGIPPEARERVFGAFERVDATAADDGLGLGLWTARRYAREAGGDLVLDDTCESGCRFCVYLPAATQAADAPPHPPTPAATPLPDPTPIPHAAPSLLLAEDDRLLRACLRESFAAAGWQVQTAADGPELITLLQDPTCRPDLLVQDFLLTGLEGLDLLAAVRRCRPDLPIIVISGWTAGEREQSLAPYRISAFIAKPFAVATLLHAATQALNRH